MPGHGLINLVLALLHAVAAPQRRHCGHRGGRRHRRQIHAPAPPLEPLSSVVAHRRVLERPPSPSPEWAAYRPLEPSDPDASPWGCRVGPCAIHGWACPNRVALAQGPSSSYIQGEAEGREEEADEHRITVVTGPVRASTVRQTARITIGPRGRPQGPLAPRTEPSPPPSPTSPTLVAPPPPPLALPPTEAGQSSFGTSADLLSPCGNQVLRLFTRFAAPFGKGRAPGSGDSTVEPSR
jgi:hypothetical protein